MPHNIPLNKTIIDLSRNPLLHIEHDYFLQFRNLVVLKLNNCGQTGPIYLPNTLRRVSLDNNYFTVDALKEMFFDKTRLLEHISLANNSLQHTDVQALLNLLPIRISQLCLYGNNLRQLMRKELSRFRSIRNLDLSNTSLVRIEPNVFDDLTHLSTIYLSDNQLAFLPDKLFVFNKHLRLLHLGNNKLAAFNAIKLGLRSVGFLSLQSNHLTSLPREVFKGVSITNLFLQKNNLSNLSGVFNGISPNLRILDLTGNMGLHLLNCSDLGSLANTSVVYLTC